MQPDTMSHMPAERALSGTEVPRQKEASPIGLGGFNGLGGFDLLLMPDGFALQSDTSEQGLMLMCEGHGQ